MKKERKKENSPSLHLRMAKAVEENATAGWTGEGRGQSSCTHSINHGLHY